MVLVTRTLKLRIVVLTYIPDVQGLSHAGDVFGDLDPAHQRTILGYVADPVFRKWLTANLAVCGFTVLPEAVFRGEVVAIDIGPTIAHVQVHLDVLVSGTDAMWTTVVEDMGAFLALIPPYECGHLVRLATRERRGECVTTRVVPMGADLVSTVVLDSDHLEGVGWFGRLIRCGWKVPHGHQSRRILRTTYLGDSVSLRHEYSLRPCLVREEADTDTLARVSMVRW